MSNQDDLMPSKQMHEQNLDNRISRRRMLEYAGGIGLGALAAGLYSRIPFASAQENIGSYLSNSPNKANVSANEAQSQNAPASDQSTQASTAQTVTNPSQIDVGTLVYPVTEPLDGHLRPGEWDKDTIPYKFNAVQVTPGKSPEAYLRAKYSDFTYFGIDIPSSTSHEIEDTFLLIFDTNNVKSDAPHASGVYNLVIYFGSTTTPEEVAIPAEGWRFPERGYTKPKDYDWSYYFGPSAFFNFPHSQFEVKIRTDILTNSGKSMKIGFNSSYVDANGILLIPNYYYPPGITMKFVDKALSEPSDMLEIGGSLLAAAYAGRKLSRRKFLGLPLNPATRNRDDKNGQNEFRHANKR
jgi:hypothetical protein